MCRINYVRSSIYVKQDECLNRLERVYEFPGDVFWMLYCALDAELLKLEDGSTWWGTTDIVEGILVDKVVSSHAGRLHMWKVALFVDEETSTHAGRLYMCGS